MKPLLIVDGYNILGQMKDTACLTLQERRNQLQEHLQNYAGYTDYDIVLVFDGYKTEKTERCILNFQGLTVVFTRRGETADSYIERYAASCPKYREICVATSDGYEQSQVMSTGAIRMSARELLQQMERKNAEKEHLFSYNGDTGKIINRLSEETLQKLESIRRGKEPDQF